MRSLTPLLSALCCMCAAPTASKPTCENDDACDASSYLQSSLHVPDQGVAQPLHFWGYNARRLTGFSGLQIDDSLAIHPPSALPRVLQNPHRDSYSQWKQDVILAPILDRIGKGFFVESGAYDGETGSNSLLYEVHKGWSGLLVEPDPKMFSQLQSKHRHSYTFHGCLSPSDHAEILEFETAGPGQGHIGKHGSFKVQAQPLQALMRNMGRSTVDFWSLDIEGSEGSVLQSTDFSQVEVGVLLIEMNQNEKNNAAIHKVMDNEGFMEVGHTLYHTKKRQTSMVLDRIFVNPKYFQMRNLAVPTSEDLDAQYRT